MGASGRCLTCNLCTHRGSKKKRNKRQAHSDTADAAADAGAGGELTPQVLELLGETVTRFYTKKNCRLHTKLIGAILQRHPSIGWRVAPTIIEHISGARDSFLCGEACNHLLILLKQHSHVGGNPLVALLPSLTVQITKVMSREGVRAKHLLPALSVAHTALRTAQSLPSADAKAFATALAAALDDSSLMSPEGNSATSTRTQCRKLLNLVEQVNAAGAPGKGKAAKKAKK